MGCLVFEAKLEDSLFSSNLSTPKLLYLWGKDRNGRLANMLWITWILRKVSSLLSQVLSLIFDRRGWMILWKLLLIETTTPTGKSKNTFYFSLRCNFPTKGSDDHMSKRIFHIFYNASSSEVIQYCRQCNTLTQREFYHQYNLFLVISTILWYWAFTAVLSSFILADPSFALY